MFSIFQCYILGLEFPEGTLIIHILANHQKENEEIEILKVDRFLSVSTFNMERERIPRVCLRTEFKRKLRKGRLKRKKLGNKKERRSTKREK